MENAEKKILTENLKTLPISQLCLIVGNDLVDMLEYNDSPINNKTISEVIVDIHGTSLFNNKIARDHFCNIASLPMIARWSNNQACKKFLQSYNLEDSFLKKPQVRRNLLDESKPPFILHNYQDDIKKQTSEFLLSDNKKLMIQLPTGAGKTSMMVESIIDFLRLSNKSAPCVIWMAHTDELCEQAIESFNRAWVNKGTFSVDLIRLWGGNASIYRPTDNPAFIVTSFQSAYSMIRTTNNEVFETFNNLRGKSDLLVVDEAHMSLAPTYNAAIDLFSNLETKLVGLTATPGRHGVDGDTEQTRKLAEFYDLNIINMNHFCGSLSPVEYLQSQDILSKVQDRKLVTDAKIDLSTAERKILKESGQLSDSVLKEIGDDKSRNQLIFQQILQLAKIDKKKILLFAASVSHSNMLAALLKTNGVKAKSITGDTNPADREAAVKDFAKNELEVLINFNIFSTGFDDPMIDCVVIARPTFSVVLYSQMIGRGLRGVLNGGTKDCLLVNFIDNFINLPDIQQASHFFDDQWN